MISRSRLPSMIQGAGVAAAAAVCFALMLQVTAVKSDIADTERAILSTKQQIATLETEFQTRARQQQLARWNEVDFGYVAPTAGQFIDGQQLAALGEQVLPQGEAVMLADASDAVAGEADNAIRVASNEGGQPAMMRQLVAQKEAKAEKPKPPVRVEPVRIAALDVPRPASGLSAADRASIVERLSPDSGPRNPSQFAESFDFGGVGD